MSQIDYKEKTNFMNYSDESSEDKQERLRCNVGRGINNWDCYKDCAFWDGERCTNFED